MVFKRVTALARGIQILELLAARKEPLGISDIAAELDLHKGTTFNMVHTLTESGVLESVRGKFSFGPKLYMLGKAAEKGSDLIRSVHPYLEDLSRKTQLSSFLGMRSGLSAVILDKADSDFNFRISSEIGIRIPLLAGAHGKAFLSQLEEKEVDDILSKAELKKFTPHSCVSKEKFKAMIAQAKEEGIGWDKEEYIEGIRALAVPLDIGKREVQTAVWVMGVNGLLKDAEMKTYSTLLKTVAAQIRSHFLA
jgi:IclR family transcriptional regulator, KDG regulon repressor